MIFTVVIVGSFILGHGLGIEAPDRQCSAGMDAEGCSRGLNQRSFATQPDDAGGEEAAMEVSLLQMNRKSGEEVGDLETRKQNLLNELQSIDLEMERIQSSSGGSCKQYGCTPFQSGRSCQCNPECKKYNSCCWDYKELCTVPPVSKEKLFTCDGTYMINATHGAQDAPCLCIFDIDRTITGAQGSERTRSCQRNKAMPNHIYDTAYSRGPGTLSAFSTEGVEKTFCSRCYAGVVSAGSGSNDQERYLISKNILSTGKNRELAKRVPQVEQWSFGPIRSGGSVKTPFVATQPDRKKQFAVEAIQGWFHSVGVCIPSFGVHFFGDRTENMGPFNGFGYNAREISCAVRDRNHHGMIGYCGAAPEEIVEDVGIHTCDMDPSGWPNNYRKIPSVKTHFLKHTAPANTNTDLAEESLSGGTCKCPNGKEYEVGVQADGTSLACWGGEPVGALSKNGGKPGWGVTCGPA